MRFYRGNYEVPSEPRKKARRFLLASLVVLFVYLIVAGDSGIYQVWHRDGQIEALDREILVLREENARLQEEAALLKDDLKTIERIARERYGMVKANESVYMVYPQLPENGMEGER